MDTNGSDGAPHAAVGDPGDAHSGSDSGGDSGGDSGAAGAGLRVGPSQLAGAGDGLFAARAFRAGELVCAYRAAGGAVLPTAEALRLQDKSYLMRLGPQARPVPRAAPSAPSPAPRAPACSDNPRRPLSEHKI
jgi:hypothetical protein